ncbi:MAG: HD-GYP domain-containing protein, partial [Nitrospirota bacterium]|nr:HD-GYP domain-containing protein [Nitrospirota bacterium]
MSTKRIPVHKLTVGMFAEELDRPWLDTPFFFHKKKIKRQEDIDEFIRYGIKTVLINTDKGLDCKEESILNPHERAHLVDIPSVPQILPSKPQDSDPVALNDELPRAKEIKTNVTNAVKNVFNDVRMGKAIAINEVKVQVNTMVDSVFRNRDALLCLTNLKDYDNYTFLHSVNVGILAVSFGRHLGLSKDQLENIGLGGLLHDIGKTQIPESILNKPGKFSEEEYTIMKRHVSLGAEILSKHDHIPQEAALVTSQHHERSNGTGYPQGLYGDKISLFGQIASMSDVYEAMTCDRVYQKTKSCHTTLKTL